jgi:hypothetical protein
LEVGKYQVGILGLLYAGQRWWNRVQSSIKQPRVSRPFGRVEIGAKLAAILQPYSLTALDFFILHLVVERTKECSAV